MVFLGKGILMLILSRREGEYIDLVNKKTGETITVLNSRYSASSMRIGIEASGDWDIVRRGISRKDDSKLTAMQKRSNHCVQKDR